MLDKIKCLQELELHIPRFYKEANQELHTAQKLFSWLLQNPELLHSLKDLDTPCSVPTWEGALDQVAPVVPYDKPYAVVAADGSQVYPDRHRSIPCYLLNSGIVHFQYGTTSSAHLCSVPRIYTQLDEATGSEDLVNCHRMEFELETGLEYSRSASASHPEIPLLFLVDGSLIVWHLESKSPALKDRFFKRYMELFDQFYKEGIPYISYISLPKARDLVSLFKNGAFYKLFPEEFNSSWDTLLDTDIMRFFLPVNARSALFTPHSRLLALYPEHVRPSFLYIRNEDEIARVEVPAWITKNGELLTTVLRMVQDQCLKGNGYPIALSEAHEQAVIRADEKEFFFTMISHLGVQHAWSQNWSQKSLKKRFAAM